jgi:hypothetical protein
VEIGGKAIEGENNILPKLAKKVFKRLDLSGEWCPRYNLAFGKITRTPDFVGMTLASINCITAASFSFTCLWQPPPGVYIFK